MKRVNLFIMMSLIGIIGRFLSPSFALAAYPEKPVTLVAAFGAGGANDVIARTIAETMKKYFPQPVVVVNRGGGGGTIGTTEVATAQPDGYTVGTTNMTSLTIQPHRIKLPYNTPDDYTPIALVGTQPFNLIVTSETPFKTLKDFIEYARANPGRLRVGTYGVGHVTDLILEELKFQAKIDVFDVPAISSGDQLALILGKNVEAATRTLFETLPYLEAGKVRVLAVIDEKRSPVLPGVPTLKELGYDITISTYTVFIGPKGLPADILSKLQEAYKKVSKDPNFLKIMESQGFTVLYEDGPVLRNRLLKDYTANKSILDRLGEKRK